MTGLRLQYPIVVISKCAECEYAHKNKYKQKPYCENNDIGEYSRICSDDNTIPAWCPLPKVSDAIKALEVQP